MKKILFLIHDLGHGGAEKVLVNLVNHMDRRKFEITVMALFGGGTNEQFLREDIRLINCHKHAIRGNCHIMKLFTPKQLFHFYIKEHYDIIASYLEGPCARIVSGCDDPGTKLVCWIHSEFKTPNQAAKGFRTHTEAAGCYRRFHQIICVSGGVKTAFRTQFPHTSNVSVLYNTYDSNRILREAKASPENWPIDPSHFRLIAMGKIVPNKGFDRLARIHKRLIEAGYPVHTFILGTGPQQRNIQKYLDENKLSDTFTFLGYQNNPYQYLSRCDLFVCASHREGFSTAVAEALVTGIPVITTKVCGMKEMLGNQYQYGCVTDNSEDALFQGIRNLMDDPTLLEHFKQTSHQRGAMFSTQATVGAVEEMLERL